MASLDDATSGKHLLLTTFRADGTGVGTPVWFVREGDRLVVTTQGSSGKVRRLRGRPDALIAACDARGRVKDGTPQVPVTVTLTDSAETARITSAIARHYGLLGRLLTRRGRSEDRQGLVLTAAVGGSSGAN